MSYNGSELSFQTPKQRRFRSLVASKFPSFSCCFIHHRFIDSVQDSANDRVAGITKVQINKEIFRALRTLYSK